MYKYKLVIFDLDGTLINSVLDLAIATNYALQHYGHPQHPEDKYRYFVGNGVDMLLYRSLPDECKNDEWVKKMRQVMMPYYAAHCTDNTAPYPGIVDMRKTIEREGIKIAIASNKHQSATAPMVAHYFGDIDFVAALGQREGFPTKPNPTIVDDILRIADVDRSRVLYVGDTAVDMQTAHNAGVSVVGVTWGFRPRTELEAEKPDFIVDTVDSLLHLILSK